MSTEIPLPGETPQAIRTWAQNAGYELPARGKIPAHIIDAYRTARHNQVLDQQREALFEELSKLECCPTCGVPQVAPDDARKLDLPQLHTLQRSVDKLDMHAFAELAVVRDQLDGLNDYVTRKFSFDGLLLRAMERIERRLSAIEARDA
jgi:hypothetical protein